MSSGAIRPITNADEKLLRFMVAKANMESLAQQTDGVPYFSPVYIAIWLGKSVSTILLHHFIDMFAPRFIYCFHGIHEMVSQPQFGWLGYLQPLPASVSLIIYHPAHAEPAYFESLTQNALRAPDMRGNIKDHYARSPASGFWIVEYNDKFVGLIAIDASDDSTPMTTLREPYPAAGIQDDLLSHALTRCFNANSTVQQIKATDSPLAPYTRKSLREAGFLLETI
ncbi:hypothetical protein K438DRAFT_1800192 [Mycena galopus ATCC 62051]|nr:hypothetical protein K438DRAFT_1800192 [Mycena galopus ATCC 62051]